MSKVSNYLENEFLDHILGVTAMTHVSTVYLALFTSDPTDAASGTEVSGGGYARQAVTFAKNGSRAAHNTSAESWTPSGAAFGTVSHWAIFDAASAGNMLYYGSFSSSNAVPDGDTFDVAANDIDITVSANGLSDYAAGKMLEHTLGIADYAEPTTVYTALYTANPGDGDSGTEVSGGGYARQATAFDAASGASANSAEESWTASGADFGTVSHIGIRDALTAGNLLFHAALSATASITDGNTLNLPSGTGIAVSLS